MYHLSRLVNNLSFIILDQTLRRLQKQGFRDSIQHLRPISFFLDSKSSRQSFKIQKGNQKQSRKKKRRNRWISRILTIPPAQCSTTVSRRLEQRLDADRSTSLQLVPRCPQQACFGLSVLALLCYVVFGSHFCHHF
jgi:hypothetical protein